MKAVHNKVACYFRVSTEKQEIGMQQHAINEWLLGLDLPPKKFDVYTDYAESGMNPGRKNLNRMLKGVYKKRYDTVVVYKLDRLTRRSADAIKMILDFDAMGISFVSVTQPILCLDSDAPFRKTMLAAFAELAEMERNMIVERIKAGMARAKAKGQTFGAKTKLTDDVLEKISELKEEGLSIRKIAKEVNLAVGTVHKAINSGV